MGVHQLPASVSVCLVSNETTLVLLPRIWTGNSVILTMEMFAQKTHFIEQSSGRISFLLSWLVFYFSWCTSPASTDCTSLEIVHDCSDFDAGVFWGFVFVFLSVYRMENNSVKSHSKCSFAAVRLQSYICFHYFFSSIKAHAGFSFFCKCFTLNCFCFFQLKT